MHFIYAHSNLHFKLAARRVFMVAVVHTSFSSCPPWAYVVYLFVMCEGVNVFNGNLSGF